MSKHNSIEDQLYYEKYEEGGEPKSKKRAIRTAFIDEGWLAGAIRFKKRKKRVVKK